MASNLIAHHLKVLTEAGLVTRTRSEGDGRRVYLRLVPETLAAVSTPTLSRPARVVFVCTHNSARSQLARALWANASAIPVASAGTDPARRIHPKAVAVAAKHGLRLGRARPVDIDDVLQEGDLVIAVCDNAHEQLKGGTRLHWSVPDPARPDTDAAFEQAFDDLAERIGRLAPILNADRAYTSG
jgi:protein-tyrosine-phosphatase